MSSTFATTAPRAGLAYQGLRGWLEQVQAIGELLHVNGAHWDVEMGAITQMLTEKSGRHRAGHPVRRHPRLPKGFRTLYGHFSSITRVALTLGLPLEHERKVDIVQRYHAAHAGPEDAAAALRQGRADPAERARRRRHRRAEIPGAAAPRADKARYIGTADCVMTQDPDAGWFNLGAYRAQVYDRKHGRLPDHRGQARPHPSRQVFRARPADEGGDPVRPGPAVVHAGVEPAAGGRASWTSPAACAASRSTWCAGPTPASRSRPMRDRHRRRDGARARCGRKARSANGWATTPTTPRPRPYVNVKTILYRNDPILCCAPQHKPVDETGLLKGIAGAAQIWRALDACGVPEMLGVWNHEAGPATRFTVDPDPPALSRPCAPGAAHRGRLPGRRLCRQVDRGGGRGHRRRRTRPGAVGDVHAVRSEHRHRPDPEGLGVQARSAVPARQFQQPHPDRRLHPLRHEARRARSRPWSTSARDLRAKLRAKFPHIFPPM